MTLERAKRKILHLRSTAGELEMLEILDILDEIIEEIEAIKEGIEDDHGASHDRQVGESRTL